MTSATLVFGLLPLALKLEEGSESRAPTAVVVIGAVISSTVLTLVAVPSIYTLFDDLQEWFSKRRKRGQQDGDHSEPTPVYAAPQSSATPGGVPAGVLATGVGGGVTPSTTE
jgi:hypothetical protein